jgi:NOL1/NOP2/fmu family ribosome biogenesis protein
MFPRVQWRKPMNTSKPEISSRQADAITMAIEGATSSGARGERAAPSKSHVEADTEPNRETIAALVKKLGAPSIAEIEKLIGDLQAARTYLESEGARIQHEMTRYAHLSDTASASVKIITQSLGQWRKGNDVTRNTGVSAKQADAA